MESNIIGGISVYNKNGLLIVIIVGCKRFHQGAQYQEDNNN